MVNVLINKLVGNEEKKRLIFNILSLGVLQGSNYILPLLTFPYLVRVLGLEYFGLLAFSTALITYFQILTDYGFNLSASRQVAIHKEDKSKIIEIYSSVIIIKSILTFLCFILLIFLTTKIKKFSEHPEVFYLSFGTIVGHVLFPVWLFHGLEKMKFITILNIGSKAIFTICIFIFVKSKDQFLLVPLFNSFGFLLAGIAALVIVNKQFKIKFEIQPLNNIIYQLREGWHIFLTNLSISMYTASTPLILGFLTNNITVGIFSGGDKIIQAAKGVYSPVTQSLYPFIARKFNDNLRSGLKTMMKHTLFLGLFMFFISLGLFYFSSFIIMNLLGAEYSDSIIILKILSPLPFLIGVSNVFGFQTLINLGYKSFLSKFYLFIGLFSLVLNFSLVPFLGGIGSAISLLTIEIIVLFTFIFYLSFVKKIFNK